MKQIIVILVFAVFGLVACNNSNQQKTSEQIQLPDTTAAIQSGEGDTLAYDIVSFPFDSTFSAKVLKVGIFHGDEVEANASKMKWFGLFSSKGKYYLDETNINTIKVNDPVIDSDEKEKSGWEVTTVNKDTSLILIEAFPFFAHRSIESVTLSKKQIYPGEEITFQYLGIDYKLFATGNKTKLQNDPERFDIANYKLYLRATIKGQERKSLLVAHTNFDEQMTNLIFAGDIDGDGILDLIIDTSRHYNVTSPTIYLSKPSAKGEVVKAVGAHTSVGC